LINGSYKTLTNNNDKVYSFERAGSGKKMIVVVNLSEKEQEAVVNTDVTAVKSLYEDVKPEINSNGITMYLTPYAVAVLAAN
jgi:alpha-amylase